MPRRRSNYRAARASYASRGRGSYKRAAPRSRKSAGRRSAGSTQRIVVQVVGSPAPTPAFHVPASVPKTRRF